MSIAYKNLDESVVYLDMKKANRKVDLKEVLTPQRVEKYSISAGGGLTYNYAAKAVDEALIDDLQRLEEDQQVIEKYHEILSGKVMNTGESRMVLHHLCRGQLSDDVMYKGENLHDFYDRQQKRINAFAADIHAGKILSSTGKKFDTVVQIGIGGSDLGPKALYIALSNWAHKEKCIKMHAHFISNVDPDDANIILHKVDFERTLFVLVSKSGTTQETLANENFVIQAMADSGIEGLDPAKHIIAVTSETSPLASSEKYLESFYIDDFIGGRYSSTSAVGGAVMILAFGEDTFERLLHGAHEADEAAMERDIRKNAALMDAMIGVHERNILDYPYTAVLPYSQALLRFPAHLQQLDMESNGKSVNRDGEPINYSTGPVIFGEPGTNGQHSFYQLLHQGTDIVPLQFIGFKNSQLGGDRDFEGSNSQTKLKANLAAQIVAFALGREHENKNKFFAGGRPSSLLYADELTPEALGALLAHYENKVMFQGLIWNIDSFDQEGVQLGKVLTKQVLNNEMDPVLTKFAELLDI